MARVCVIDDDPDFRALLVRHLQKAGYQVTEAADGREGRASILASPPDLVITDLAMPEESGIELLVAVKRKHPDLPVMVVTGEGRPITVALDLARRNGADAMLGKPLARGPLLSLVERLLAGERPHAEPLDLSPEADDGVYMIMPPNLLREKVRGR